MPFRYAHWGLLALAPVIVLAFWPAYFGNLRQASFAFHAHGLAASAWLVLVGLQSLTAQTRNFALHRTLGRALFAVVPLFAGAAVLVVHSMAVKFATRSDPFYAVLGARLGLHDIVSTPVLVGLVCAALAYRRRMALHAACMLSTVLLVLPPVVERLPVPHIFHLGEFTAIVLALLIAALEPKGRTPLLLVAAVQGLQIVLFETVGASAAWSAAFAAFSTMPVAPFAVAACAAALCALLVAWKRTMIRTVA